MNDLSLRSLYDLYANDVYRFARLTLGDVEEARDVTQDVFFRAHKAWNDFKGESNPKTWLMAIARNCTFDLLRKRQVRQKALRKYALEHSVNNKDYSEEMLILQEAILQLKDTYRELFVLRHVHNYSVHDTSVILGWSQSKVTTTDQRASQKLRSILGGDNLYGKTR